MKEDESEKVLRELDEELAEAEYFNDEEMGACNE